MSTLITSNRTASHDYFIGDSYEAGIKLIGNEVKTLRDNKFIINQAWVEISNGEVWLINSHIPNSISGDLWTKTDPYRKRKLLLNKSEIRKLNDAIKFNNKTIIPLNAYFRNGKAKVTIAICTGKKNYDKRNSEKNLKYLSD